jgi:hypothetical protein
MGIVRFALKFPYTFHVLDTFMSAHSSISDMMLQRRERRNGPLATFRNAEKLRAFRRCHIGVCIDRRIVIRFRNPPLHQ